MKKNILRFVISFATFFTGDAKAAIINATSCSSADIQDAVNAASDGDIVMVPAGNCTWTSGLSIPDTKGITLKGAGANNTIVTTGYSITITTFQQGCLQGFRGLSLSA